MAGKDVEYRKRLTAMSRRWSAWLGDGTVDARL